MKICVLLFCSIQASASDTAPEQLRSIGTHSVIGTHGTHDSPSVVRSRQKMVVMSDGSVATDQLEQDDQKMVVLADGNVAMDQVEPESLARERLDKEGTVYIDDVPIYNYYYNSTGLLEVELEKSTRKWILMLRDGVSAQQISAICALDTTICTPEGTSGLIPFVKIVGTKNDLQRITQAHKDVVDFAEPDFEMGVIPDFPSGPSVMSSTSSQSATNWGLNHIGVTGFNSFSQGAGVHVYVLDTGIRTSHVEFGGRAFATLDLTSGSPKACDGSPSCASDSHGHGTHCAGTVGGASLGVAPKATLHGVKVLADNGFGDGSWTIAAIDWIIKNGQRPSILSMSLGAQHTPVSDKVAIDKAIKSGVIVVVAAGNDDQRAGRPAMDACSFGPAFVPSAITVGSIDQQNQRSGFSNFGSCLDIYAPGSSIWSASHQSDSGAEVMSGTSMACPHVSGAAALIVGDSKAKTQTEVLAWMLANAKSGLLGNLRSGDPNKLLFLGTSSPSPSPTPNQGCSDVWPAAVCSGMKQLGHCTMDSWIKDCKTCEEQEVKRQCRNTCNLCGAQPDPLPGPPGPTPSCVDTQSVEICSNMNQWGYCAQNKKDTFVKPCTTCDIIKAAEACSQSCGLCR